MSGIPAPHLEIDVLVLGMAILILETFAPKIDKKVFAYAGIVAGIANAQGRAYFSYGRRSLDTPDPVDERTLFEIGSVTKKRCRRYC